MLYEKEALKKIIFPDPSNENTPQTLFSTCSSSSILQMAHNDEKIAHVCAALRDGICKHKELVKAPESPSGLTVICTLRKHTQLFTL